jgi:hypothetical protein
MYSLIEGFYSGEPLNIPLPSLIIVPDLFLVGILLAVGLFILTSHIRSQKYSVLILIILGLSFSLASYLVQNYMDIYYPELFIPGGPHGTWYVFRNNLSSLLAYAAVLVGVLIPACFLLRHIKFAKRWNYLILLSTLVLTAILYYSYRFSVMITPGSNINLPWLFPATYPLFTSITIAVAILGFFFILSEFFSYVKSWPVSIIFATTITAFSVFLTYQTAVAVYAVMVWLLITKYLARIKPICLISGIMILAIICEFLGSYFASLGPDSSLFTPVWIFPVLFMSLIILVPAPHFLAKFSSKMHNFVIFGVALATGVLNVLVSVVFSTGIYAQPDILPQTHLSIAINTILCLTIAVIIYHILSINSYKVNKR